MNRTEQPPFKKSLEFNLPTPEKIHSAGECEIWYLPSTISEAVKIEILFKAGKYYENFIGDAPFTLQLLNKGTAGKNAHDIANELDYFGSHLDLKVGHDFSAVSLYVLKKNIDQLLPLLFSIIQRPSFPPDELDLLKKIVGEHLKVNLEKNEFVASNLIREKIYGVHPYGKNTQLKDIEDVTLERVNQFFTERFKPFKIFIVGNVEDSTIQSIVRNIDFSGTNPKEKSLPVPGSTPEKKEVKGPNKMQASIRLGNPTISRTHPDWAGLQLANHILGGYFGSRLMKNIREEKGLTYGIHSSIQSMLHSAWINISAEVNSDSSDLALEEIHKELVKLIEISPAEIEMARNHLIGSLQNDVTTIFAASERIKSIILNTLPFDFYQTLIHSIDSIDEKNLERISQSYFAPDLFSSLVVKG